MQRKIPHVRYLRMATNAMAVGALVAMYLAILVLQLNPQLSILSVAASQWFFALFALYGLYLSVVLYFLIVVREFLGSRSLAPAWLSVRLLAWLGAAGAGAAAVVTWANLQTYRPVLTADAAERMRQGAIATTAAAVLLLLIAILRASFGRRGSRATGVLLALAMALSVIVPLALRGPVELSGRLPVPSRLASPAPASLTAPEIPLPPETTVGRRQVDPDTLPRVRLILLDGASLGFIRQRAAAGQLPNFGRLLDRGAAIDLITPKPAQAAPVWAAAATGKYAPKNGVRSDSVYRVRADEAEPVDLLPDYCFAYALIEQQFVRATPVTKHSLDARPLWQILSDYGLVSGIVGWPLTSPAHADLGYVVSDRFDEGMDSPLAAGDPEAAHPITAMMTAREAFNGWLEKPVDDVLPGVPPGALLPETLADARWDRAYSQIARELNAQFAPRLTAVRYRGLDSFGHFYLRDAQPELFGTLRRATPGLSPLDRYFAFIDSEVGEAMRQLNEGDLLLVVSAFGMEPMPMLKRGLDRLLFRSQHTGSHEAGPPGFLLAYGSNVAYGQFTPGAIVDLAPTVLYYMGLHVGRDMDGFPRTDLFTRDFSQERPVKQIATHGR
jgi:hypothetical protein